MRTRGRVQVSAQMPAIIEAGINSFKFFFAYKGALAVGDDLFLDGLQRSKELGALPMVGRCGPWLAPHACHVHSVMP